MSSVDERIVKMTFENDKFEAGVRKTLDTLEALKEKLTFKDHDKSFKGLETSMNNVNFNGIESGVESLQKRFSTLGIVGMEVTKRITNAAIDAGKKLVGATLGQAKTGGMTRSLNIEQAQFQLEGLLKDGAKVKAVMDAASNAVDGTAYGLDEAAKAASVLAASGITDATKLQNILKSVAGGAAMTGRNFSDIADIYSTVASNGKLMTMQLRQFSASGLNVSARLADEFGTSEEVVNEWVRKGEISFEEFSDAMMYFSDQAGKANDTFTGSLSNMKSALNRIGQIFTDPYVDNMKYVFNAARLGLNEVKNAIAEFKEPIENTFAAVRTFIVDGLGALTGGKDEVTGEYIFGPLGEAARGLVNIFKYLYSAIIPIGSAFKAVFPKATVENLGKLMIKFGEFTKTLKLNERQAKNMEYLYKGIFSIFKLFGVVIKTVVDGVNRMLKPFGGLLNILNFVIGVVGRLVYWFVTAVTKVRIVCRVFTLVTKIIGGVFQIIVNLVKAVSNFVKQIARSKPVVTVVTAISNAFKTAITFIKSFIDRIRDLLKRIGEFVGNAATKAISKLIELLSSGFNLAADAVRRLVPKIKQFLDAIKNSKAMQAFVKAINNARTYLSIFVDKLKEFGKAVADWMKDHQLVQKFFNALAMGLAAVVGVITVVAIKIKDFVLRVKEFLEKKGLIEAFSDIFHKALEKIKEGLEFVIDKIKQFAEFVQSHLKNPMDDIGNSAKTAGDKLKKMFSFTSIKGGLKALGGYLIAGFKSISSVVPILKDIAGNITGILGSIIGYLKDFITNFLGSFKQLDAKTLLDYFPYEALGVLLLAISKAVSRGSKVAKGLSGMFDSISGAFGALTERLKGGSKMQKASKTLLTFAVALGVFALSVGYFAKMDPNQLKQGLIVAAGALAAVTGSLIIIGKVLDKMKGINFAQVGVGLLGISVGMLILTAAVKRFGEMDNTVLAKGLGAVAAALVILTAAVKYGLGSASHMASTGFGLLMIAGALMALLGVVLIFNKIDWRKNAAGVIAVAVGLGILAVAVRIMGSAQVKGVALAILAMSAAMMILVIAVKALAKIDTTSLAVSMGGIAAMLIVMAGSLYALSKNEAGVKSAALSLVLLAAGLGILAYAIYQLSGCDLEGLKTSIIGLSGILAVMAIALYALANNSGIDSAARNLVILAAGLSVLSLAISVMASMPLDGLKTSLIGLTILLGAMAVSLYALAKLPTAELTGAAAAMVILAAGIAVLAVSIALLASLPVDGLTTAMVALGLALLAMVAAGYAAESCSVGLIVLAAAFVAFGAAVYLVSEGVAIVVKAFSEGASKLVPLVEKIRQIINDVFQGVCDVITSVGDAIAKVVDSISSGISGVLDSVAGVFDSMGNAARSAGEGVYLIASGISKLTNLKLGDMAATLAKVADALKDFSKNSKEMSETGDGVRDMANGLQKVATFGNMTATAFTILAAAFNILRPALDGIPQSLTTASSAFSSFSSSLLTFGVGIGVAVSGVITQFQAFNNSVMSVTTSISALTAVSAIVSMVMSIVVSTTNAAKASLDALRAGAGTVGIALSTIGSNAAVAGIGLSNMTMMGISAMSGLTSAIVSGGNKAKSAMTSAMNSMMASTKSTLNSLSSVGTLAMGKLASGIRSGATTVRAAVSSVATDMKSAATTAANSLYSAGVDCASGFARGIRSGTYLATSAGSAIGKAALEAAKRAVDSNSPSKEFIKLGKDVDRGFVMGIENLQNKVYNASYTMGREAVEAVTDPMKKVYDILNQDLDMNPTITPVLDLSSINSGIDQLDNMLNTRQLSANVSNSMSGIGLIPAYAGANNSISNNTTNTFNITVDGTENPEAFADRLVRQFQLRGRMA